RANEVAILPLQRRARHHHASGPCNDGSRHILEKRPPVFVVERLAGRHFGDVRGRMERVAFHESPSQRLCQRLTERRLAATTDTHDDDGFQHHFFTEARSSPSSPTSTMRGGSGVPLASSCRIIEPVRWPSARKST